MAAPRFVVLVFAALMIAPAACRKADVTSYRVPKEKDPVKPDKATGAAPAADPPVSAPAMAGTPVATASGPGLSWTAPIDWKIKPPSAMRKGSYTVPGEGGAEADLSITAFPNDVGGEFANVNRWRGQIKLAPLVESDLPDAITRLEQNGLKFALVDFANSSSEKPQRILGAIVPFEGATWFFKLSGPDAVVAGAKPSFLEFLKTVKTASNPAP